MYDYGNARVAARRSRLLGAADHRRLSEAASPAALLALLGGFDDWRSVAGDVSALAGDPGSAVDAAIERHRSRRLGALRRWYEGPARRLVEALVLPLDTERLVAILRRRAAGEPPEAIGAAVGPGALLGAGDVGRLARAPSIGRMLELAATAGVVGPDDARAIGRLAAAGAMPSEVEAAIVEASDRARLRLAAGRGDDARLVRELIEREVAVRRTGLEVLGESGAGAGALVERGETLARLDGLASIGRRDPLGIGAVAGYVAAVEVGAIRLRAILAGVAAGWSEALLSEYLEPRRAALVFGAEA